MSKNVRYRWRATAFAIVFTGLSAWPTAGAAQTVTGQARAVQANAVDTAALADTGTLGGTSDARDATLDFGIVPSVVSAEVLRAVTIGWPDQVASETSIANLRMTVGGTGISAGFVMAKTLALLGGPSTASSIIHSLSVNGIPVAVTGVPNQLVSIPGGRMVINEQTVSPGGSTTVNALHATVFGLADVVIASATAGVF